MIEIDLLRQLGIALGIGLLVGLERGWRQRDQVEGRRVAGMRTFALTGLSGGVAAALTVPAGPLVLGAALIVHAAAVAAFHLVEARSGASVSATTTVAAILTFLLGAFAVLGDPRIAVAAAVATALLLALREPLHGWLRAVTWEEVRAVLTLLAMTFLFLPVLPDRPLDPWGAVNPAEVWLLAILVAAISFAGYVAVRLLGDRWGMAVAAGAGGLVSSTAVTLSLARAGRADGAHHWLLAAGILIAGAVMVTRVGIVTALLNAGLALSLAGALAAAVAVLGLAAFWLLRSDGKSAGPGIAFGNPLEVVTALKLAAFLAVVMLAAAIARDVAGGAGVLAVAALSGIADVDAVTLSMARPGAESSVGLDLARTAILVAVGVNTLSKAMMTLWIGGRGVGVPVLSASLTALAAAAGAMTLVGA
ncbi:MAG: hypothetical protein RLY86_536 [Pseudomonadota bacterium]